MGETLSFQAKIHTQRRPENKTVEIGLTDRRRETYFKDFKKDTVIQLPGDGRFNLDLFFIAPFYHLLLPHLDHVIVVDLDLEFRCKKKTRR